MTESASKVKTALLASMAKLENSNYLTEDELVWLRGSIMRLIAEFEIPQEKPTLCESESAEPNAA
jgi:hypothetical protein